MRLLFVSIPTYRVILREGHAYWHRVRRLGADRISELVSSVQPSAGKKSLCRGLWLLASEAKRVGHEVRWIDVPPDRLSVPSEDLAWADQLWLYAMTPTVGRCLMLAAHAKSINDGIIVFLGGPHTRYLFEETLRDNIQIDFVESSPTPASSIVEHIDNPMRIPGIAYRVDRKIKVNHSEIPKIYSEKIDSSVLTSPLRSYYINTSLSQGCCRTCAFCLDGQLPIRIREMDDVKEELRVIDEALGEDGSVHFFDASLWTSPERCVKLAEFIASSTVIGSFSCDLEARPVRDDVLYALRSARIRSIAIGFESCNNNILNFVGKNGTFEERIAIAKHIRTAMPYTAIKAYWLIGLPGSTKSTLKDELTKIRYVLDEGIVDLVSAKLFVPYPGTPFYERPDEFGLKLTRNYAMFDRFFLPPACFPASIGRDYLARILIECEKLIAECYARRLGISHKQIAMSAKEPLRYNGLLYVGEDTRIGVARELGSNLSK